MGLNGCRSRSRWEKVLSEVPQGSILGPLLFTIYMDDLPQLLSSLVLMHMFVDDTKLICTIQSVADHNQLQTDFDCLLQWYIAM